MKEKNGVFYLSSQEINLRPGVPKSGLYDDIYTWLI